MVEVGYRYKFFGDDAEVRSSSVKCELWVHVISDVGSGQRIGYGRLQGSQLSSCLNTCAQTECASQEVCDIFSTDEFSENSGRNRLLARGHRVGIVNQVETAALKKISENKNTPFTRKLIHLYTATTWVTPLWEYAHSHFAQICWWTWFCWWFGAIRITSVYVPSRGSQGEIVFIWCFS